MNGNKRFTLASTNGQPARQMGNHAKTWQGLPPNCEPWPWLPNCNFHFAISTLCTWTCWEILQHNASLLGSVDDAASGSHNGESGQSRSLDFVWSSCTSGFIEITAEVLDPSIIQRNRFSAGSSCWGCTTTTSGRCSENGTWMQIHQHRQSKQMKFKP